jgi:hypothetical protein
MRYALLVLVCPLLSGCLAFGYPSVTRTPAIAVDAPDVKAFRVVAHHGFFGCVIAGAIIMYDEADEIPVTKSRVEPQKDTHFSYSWMIFPVWADSRFQDLKVMLYRPGYEIVEIPAKSWWRSLGDSQPEPVTWKAAPDLASQKSALDRLAKGRLGLMADGREKKMAEYAASEYTRLADSPQASAPGMEAVRDELRKSAEECAKHAARPK